VRQSRGVTILNYRRFYNAHIQRLHSGLSCAGFEDSSVSNIPWSNREKALFFDALARYGRSGVVEIGREVGKSPFAVAMYMALLQTSLQSTPRKDLIAYRDLPAAVEVHEDTLEREEDMSLLLARRADLEYAKTQSRIGWSCISSTQVAEFEDLAAHMPPDKTSLLEAVMPDLFLIDYTAATKTGRSLYRCTSQDLYARVKIYTQRLMACALDVAQCRANVESGIYFDEERFRDSRGICDRDVYAALHVLHPSLHLHTKQSTELGTKHPQEDAMDEAISEHVITNGQAQNGEPHDEASFREQGYEQLDEIELQHDPDDDDDDDDDDEDEMVTLLDNFDTHRARQKENEYRQFLALDNLPDATALTPKQLARLGKLSMREHSNVYDTSHDTNNE